MKGFVLGLILVPAAIVFILSLRPGGLRRQFRAIGRRFRLALALGGIYVFATAILRLAFRDGPGSEWGIPAVAVILGLVFVILAQDREPGPTRSP